jgi:hypothetical protein
VTDHQVMTQMWTFVTADDEPTARELALTHACHGDVLAGGTTVEAIELEPGRWRVMVALQPAPVG